ncbi:CYTH domain-containing protein [Thalassotalea agarivorans]|uniref:Triphosphatase n=1 Tax=Thalassotalea agarivorans TaxID=349064 RepID=A0A1I0HTB3_THASX|nr:CYTH domain-containing protein [Thalassotalea agarivorans]SET87301.1 triphosphatase [Thalassotalea agarivorans]
MDTEIELKFLVQGENVADNIRQCLTHHNFTFKEEEKTLKNTYFDTPDLKLRQLDYGLRIRTYSTFQEQTIKTRGQVVSGLHSRPEYNVEISGSVPELALFPEQLWQDASQCQLIQEQLTPLFDTHFVRQVFTVENIAGGSIELAYDSGSISSNNGNEKINEIELELLSGARESLFLLAEKLFEFLPLRVGNVSKAARGYALFHRRPIEPDLTPLSLIAVKPSDTLDSVFSKAISESLAQLHGLINAYTQRPRLIYLVKMTEMLAIMRHGFWMFEQALPAQVLVLREQLSAFMQQFSWVDKATYLNELTNKTGNFRRKIEYSEQLIEQLDLEQQALPEADSVIQILHSQSFNQLLLELLKLVLAIENNGVTVNPKNEKTFDVARACLDVHFQNLIPAMASQTPLPVEQYLERHKLVVRSLLTGCWFGNLFDKAARLEFRNPWLDIKQGISELEVLWLLHQQLLTLDTPEQKLLKWQSTKLSKLLVALESSRLNALEQQPYWLAD